VIVRLAAEPNPTTFKFTTKTTALYVCRHEHFSKLTENIFVLKTYQASRGVVKIYEAGVVTHHRGIGPLI
jgi:hypothetical protein